MRCSASLLTAACALGARAILIPAGITPSSNINDIAVVARNPKSQTIQVPCSSCAFSPKDGSLGPADDADDLFWTQGQENSLVLEFTVSEDGERLLLNNRTIYPFSHSAADRTQISVAQIPWSASIEAYESQEVRAVPLGITASLVTIGVQKVASEDGDLVIPLTFGIVELEQQHIDVDRISVEMLKTVEGELLILGLTNIPNLRHHPSSETLAPLLAGSEEPDHVMVDAPLPAVSQQIEESQICNALCQFKAMVGSRVMGLKQGKISDCGGAKKLSFEQGRLPTHDRPNFLRPVPEGAAETHSGRPHHRRPHGSHHRHGYQHHGHHRHHGFMTAFMRGFVSILIPTLAGIFVGMGVSMLGLAVSRLITFLWTKLAHVGCGYASVAQEKGDAEKDPKASEETEALPVYEAAPAYEEIIKQPK